MQKKQAKGKDMLKETMIVTHGKQEPRIEKQAREDKLRVTFKESKNEEDKRETLVEHNFEAGGSQVGEIAQSPDVDLSLNKVIDPGEPRLDIGLAGRFAGRFWANPTSLDDDNEMVEETILGTVEGSIGPCSKKERQFIHLQCRHRGSPSFCLTAVYAIPSLDQKRILWEELESYADSISEPWVLIGDFNNIAAESERIGGNGFNATKARLFTDRVRRCKLTDLGAVGPQFTWKGPRLAGHRRLYERLDRAMANVAFLTAFSDYFVQEELERLLRLEEINFVKNAFQDDLLLFGVASEAQTEWLKWENWQVNEGFSSRPGLASASVDTKPQPPTRLPSSSSLFGRTSQLFPLPLLSASLFCLRLLFPLHSSLFASRFSFRRRILFPLHSSRPGYISRTARLELRSASFSIFMASQQSKKKLGQQLLWLLADW
ncbi:hypothetical protein K1719_019744 [Acacia pycnantha]|nr:hypothetical protein K1719_019744 [Acacia pycnantha]